MTDSSAARHRGAGSRTHTVLRVVVVSVVVLALLTGLTVIYAYRHLNGNLTVADIEDQLKNRPDKIEVEGPKEPLNILVMGSDARAGEGNNIDGLVGGGRRSDTTIVMHVSADRERAYGISIPRDSMVQRPECLDESGDVIPASDGLVMFNEAFAIGGPACTVQTVEQLTGIRIDDYVLVDFNGFKDMVDAIGGVQVCIPEDVSDPAHDIYLEAGTQVVSGQEALNYVRERHELSANGDIGRMKRQQAFIASMANKVMSAGTLARPDRLFRFLEAATKSLQLSEGLGSLAKMVDLGLQFRDIGLENVVFFTVPMKFWEVNPNRVIWTDEAELVWERIRHDEPIPASLVEGRITAAAPPGTSEPEPSEDATAAPSQSSSADPGDSPSDSPSPTESALPTEAERDAMARANGLCT